MCIMCSHMSKAYLSVLLANKIVSRRTEKDKKHTDMHCDSNQ